MTQFYLYSLSLFFWPILAHLKYNKFQFELEMPLFLCISENTLAMADEHSHKYGNILQNKFMDTFSHTHKISEILSVGLGFIWRFVTTITLDSRKF